LTGKDHIIEFYKHSGMVNTKLGNSKHFAKQGCLNRQATSTHLLSGQIRPGRITVGTAIPNVTLKPVSLY